MAAAATPAEIDAILDRLEAAAKQVETSHDSQVVPKAEEDLLKHLLDLRRSIDTVTEQLDRDDDTYLQSVFGGDCKRIGRTRAILEGLRFGDDSEHAKHKSQCVKSCELVEEILGSTGSRDQLKLAQESERKALFERIRRELELDYASEIGDDDDKMSEVWDDHPEGASPMPALSVSLPPPSELSGNLWKKSPSPMLALRQWKWRWMTLAEGKLRWFTSEADAAGGNKKALRGEIDFSLNPCTVACVASHSTQFAVRPAGGKWVLGSFTGAAEGREFLFDAFSSQFDREAWVCAIKSHQKHGGQAYGGTRLSFMGR